MNDKQTAYVILGLGAAIFTGSAYLTYRNTRNEEREKRKAILTEMGLDVAAIHNATDVVNKRIEKGEIRNLDQLREAVLTEVAFQKITIREEE